MTVFYKTGRKTLLHFKGQIMENERLQKYIENFRKHFLFSENERELQVQFCKKIGKKTVKEL